MTIIELPASRRSHSVRRRCRHRRTQAGLPMDVYVYRGKYRSQLRYQGKHRTLGISDSAYEAGILVVAAKMRFHGLGKDEAINQVFSFVREEYTHAD